MRFDIKDPSSPFMLDVTNFGQEIWLFQQLFGVWSAGGRIEPSPIGSVFIVDSLHPSPQFDFIHCLVTGVVAIDIGGKLIVVFLWDQGDAVRGTVLDQWEKWHAPRVKVLAGHDDFEANCALAPHVWACESAYWIYRHRRPYSMIKTPTQFVLMPTARRPPKPADEAEYRQVCRNFGLDLVTYNGDTNNQYSAWSPADGA